VKVRLKVRLLIVLAPLALWAVIFLTRRPCIPSWVQQHRATTKRVTVIYPENWAVNEYRNCSLLEDAPILDCLPEHITQFYQFFLLAEGDRAERRNSFVMDVKFSGNDKQPNWTCQNTGPALVCQELSR
jgi:hypothetical protein